MKTNDILKLKSGEIVKILGIDLEFDYEGEIMAVFLDKAVETKFGLTKDIYRSDLYVFDDCEIITK